MPKKIHLQKYAQQYTPGPWVAQQDLRSCHNTGIFDGSNPDRYGNPNKWGIYDRDQRIAQLEEEYSHLPQREIDANARLIAQAPNLLEILMVILDVWDTHQIIGPTVYHDARAIIDKALKGTD